MHYTLKLADGMVADSSVDGEPVSFVVGDGTLDKGLELALIGLRAGQRQTLTLMPGQAFGQRDENAVQQMELAQFPSGLKPEPGKIIGFSGPQDEEVPGMILEVADGMVTVDFNHPLAGREIVFEVEILSVDNPEGE